MKLNLRKILISITALIPLYIIYFFILNGDIQFLTAGHESFSYRFLVSSRIVNGENLVWFPQGHLTSFVHNLIMMLSGWNDISISELNSAIQGFGLFHHFVIFLILLLSVIILHKKLNYNDIFNTYFLGLSVPIFASGIFSTHYFIQVDYLTLNIILMVISLALFHYGMNLKEKEINIKHHIFVAIFIGIVVSNKITMLPIAIFSALPFIFKHESKFNINYLSKITFLYGIISSISSFIVIVCFFNFNISNMVQSAGPMIKFILNPGATEPLYNFLQVIINYKFIYFMVINLIISMLALFFLKMGNLKLSSKRILISIFLLSALLWFFILKRGATMTLFESTYGLTIFSLGITKILKVNDIFKNLFFKYLLEIILILLVLTGLNQFKKSMQWITEAGKNQTIAFESYATINQYTEGKKKYFITYDNNLSAPSIEMFLRKGLSIIPTWSHKDDTLIQYSHLCENCKFISSYTHGPNGEYLLKDLEKDSYVITYLPEFNTEKVIEFEKNIIRGLPNTKLLEISEELYGNQNFKITIKYIE
jgi:hypothetical protein